MWIYPFLYEVMLGAPVKKNVEVSLSKLWSEQKDHIAVAVRYLAAEQYFGRNDFGYEIYKKSMSLFVNEKTAGKRLEKYIELIKSWEKNGYDSKQVSSVMENGCIINGMHRISLGFFFGQMTICCDVYPASKPLEEIHAEISNPKLEDSNKLGFTQMEIAALRKVNEKLTEQYLSNKR